MGEKKSSLKRSFSHGCDIETFINDSHHKTFSKNEQNIQNIGDKKTKYTENTLRYVGKSQEKSCLGFRKTIIACLKKNGFDIMRSSKMSQKDFLRLLVEMNTNGVYFS